MFVTLSIFQSITGDIFNSTIEYSNNVFEPISSHISELVSTQVSEPAFVKWKKCDDNQTPKVLKVDFGNVQLITQVNFYYDDDDYLDCNKDKNTDAKRIAESEITVSNEGTFYHAIVKVVEKELYDAKFKFIGNNINYKTDLKLYYISMEGEESPEDFDDFDDSFKLPFPIQKDHGDKADSWEICGVNKVNVNYKGPILFKITFIL